MKFFLYSLLIVAFILVTFFGLGPVLLADGSINERIITLLAVLVLYIILIWSFLRVLKYYKATKK